MDYNHISSFLSGIKKNLFKNREYYEIIASIVERHIGLVINVKLIKIKGSIITIQSSPIIKNEILIHKEGILKDLKDLLLDKNFKDIN